MCHITGYKMDGGNYHRIGQIIYSVKGLVYTQKIIYPNIFLHLNVESDNKYYF